MQKSSGRPSCSSISWATGASRRSRPASWQMGCYLASMATQGRAKGRILSTIKAWVIVEYRVFTDNFNAICDRIWENPPYGIRAQFAQCAFLVAQVEICQSPDFVMYMLNNPSFNCCRVLRRLVTLYEGEISLHFDPPSRHSRRTQSPLLWAVIRILYLDTARFIDLLYVR